MHLTQVKVKSNASSESMQTREIAQLTVNKSPSLKAQFRKNTGISQLSGTSFGIPPLGGRYWRINKWPTARRAKPVHGTELSFNSHLRL